jgi:hypothetical protein
MRDGIGDRLGCLKEEGFGEDFLQGRVRVRPAASTLLLVVEPADPAEMITALRRYGAGVVNAAFAHADAEYVREARGVSSVAVGCERVERGGV